MCFAWFAYFAVSYSISFICLGVSNHASVAHGPKRSESTCKRHNPPFFKSIAMSGLPETNRATNWLKKGSWPTSRTFSDAGLSSFNCRTNALGSPSGVNSSEKARRFFSFSDLATISAVCRARTNGLESIKRNRKSIFLMASAICRSWRLPLGVSGRSASVLNPGVPRSAAIPCLNM
jgi:hypothetical protein